MIEVIFRRSRHAEALHDAARALVGANRHGDDFPQPELTKAIIERGSGGLGGVAMPPIGLGEPPSDLHGRCEVRLIRDRFETDNPDKARFSVEFEDPLYEAVLVTVSALSSRPGLGRQPAVR